MTNIKITVTFEESKPSRIDALLKEYEIASTIANETKRELTPIIKEVGLAKHAAIMKQLEPIMDGMKKLSILKDKIGCTYKDVELAVYYKHPCVDERQFIVKYSFQHDEFYITYCMGFSGFSGYNFKNVNSDQYNLMYGEDRGIVTHWNKLGIIDKLTVKLEKVIKDATESMTRTKNNIERQLNNLIND